MEQMEDSEKHDEDSNHRVLRSATENVPERFSTQRKESMIMIIVFSPLVFSLHEVGFKNVNPYLVWTHF